MRTYSKVIKNYANIKGHRLHFDAKFSLSFCIFSYNLQYYYSRFIYLLKHFFCLFHLLFVLLIQNIITVFIYSVIFLLFNTKIFFVTFNCFLFYIYYVMYFLYVLLKHFLSFSLCTLCIIYIIIFIIETFCHFHCLLLLLIL